LQYGKIINEVEIEEQLKRKGFTIIHPEYLSLREQVKLISTSRIVAGFDGSAFYSSLFSRKLNGAFFVFNRRKSIPEALLYALEKKEVKHHKNRADVQLVSGDGAGADFLVLNPEDIVTTLCSV
jgi:hypothetical protein